MTGRWTGRDRPLPYFGPIEQRIKRLGAPYVERTCGADASGTVPYGFNSLGFRCPEFNALAPIRIYCFGESNAFGTGVPLEQAWPALVTLRVCEQLALPPEDICAMNFAENGASNAAIARMVTSQCSAAPPDLVLVNFAEPTRTEGVVGERLFHVGPWFGNEQWRERILTIPEIDARRAQYAEAMERGLHYLEFTNVAHGRLAMLRELLLAQYFLAHRGIPALATCPRHLDPTHGELGEHPGIGPLIEQVDPDFFAAHAPVIDRAVDQAHPGPRSHAAIADEIYQRLVAQGILERLRGLDTTRSSTQRTRR